MRIEAAARWTFVALSGVILAASGCEARVSLGAPCALASECPEPLVCLAGRCRTECVSVRDCPRGGICLAGEGGLRACELEGADACTTSASCGARLLCLEGRCTNECVGDADCVSGARCHPSAGCVECAGDVDCPTSQRCGADHACEPECASDADCVGGLVCRADRCVLATHDGGAPDAELPPVESDSCDAPFVVPLPPAPQRVVVRVAAAPWTDGAPSCSLAPDGYLALESSERALAILARIDETSVHIGEVDDCASHVLDCAQVPYSQLSTVLEPGRTTFAVDDEEGTNRIEVSVTTTGLGPDTIVDYLPDGVVDAVLVLDGEGRGACSSGGASDALVFAWLSASGSGHLVADAPGVELQWVILDAGSETCDPPAVGHAEADLRPSTREPSASARLIARGVSGPVSVRLSGTILY